MATLALPQDWKSDEKTPNFKSIGSLSPAIDRKIEPFGAAFLAHARRQRHGRTFSEDDRIQALAKVKKTEDDDDGEISEPEDPLMLQRDAKDWKGQDHYAVLGLSKHRYRATDEQIKRAHRKKVLKHHPDKRAAAGQAENDSFFKCIQRAHETLTDPKTRRQFDSVDEAADVAPPTKKEMTSSSKSFFKKWNAFFESEARFSNKQPVPKIGDDKSTKEDVEEFYDFWYNFDSWRSFEYLDEDVPDDNADRDHKRHIEKKNRNARIKRKTEDTARLRNTVDTCLQNDERIKKFRQAASKNKNAKRLEKEAKEKKEAEDKAAAAAAAEKQKKEDEEKAKADKDAAKKSKEAAKTAVKKNKRVVKGAVKDVNYFSSGADASAAQVDAVLDDVDRILASTDPDELADLVSKLNVAGKDGEKVKGVFTERMSGLTSSGKVKEGDVKVFK
ncbi:Zuotin [Cyphellophora attinorum]|uniref:Zuotin n=1 Tax=Cyphellophora attinorum TaxID=1664694 RepID=A0A0N1HFM0_9EURO|nr:Zuotin [Phialophora attinorum]KPI44062.1 Zuotin [Phialophora attinorum]